MCVCVCVCVCVLGVRRDRYDLWAREDIHTKGNIQWFYFAVRNTKALQRVRFTIVNNNKSDSLFNYGMKPLVYVRCAVLGSTAGI